jgi:hypothetical protein
MSIRIDKFNKGYSYKITDKILEIIENSGLMIADLSLGNKNVYHEIGYLMGLNQQRESLRHKNIIFIFDNNSGDTNKDIGFNLKGWKQIRFDSTRILEEELTKSIEIFYELRQPE